MAKETTIKVENLVAGDFVKRYGWWYRVLKVIQHGDRVELTAELCGSHKIRNLLMPKGTQIKKMW